MSKIIFLIIILMSIITLNSFKPDNEYGADFIEFWSVVKENYAYFDKKQTDWDKVKEVYLPLAENAADRDELITVFENAIEELYDNHFSLNTNLKTSTRLVPSGLDFWAEYINGKAVVTEVRKGSTADLTGVKTGMEILSINGISIDQAVNDRIGKCITNIDPDVRNYSLKQLLAGTYLVERIIEFSQNGGNITINLDEASENLTGKNEPDSLFEFRIIEDNIGYIKFNNSLGETNVIPLFDNALKELKDTRALIIDLRDTPGGGNSVVARGIMSRFITSELPYQKHVLPIEEKEFGIKRSWFELVTPRGPFTYENQVVLLVDHWTGSMGEGITIGFDALGRAKITGTKMASLNGAIYSFKTTNTKIPYSFPAEQLYHIKGTPREDFVPEYLTDLTDQKYKNTEDPVLTEGINIINSTPQY